MEPLTIRLLGSPVVMAGQKSLSFRTRKALALLVYLVVAGDWVERETLMALLWPDRPPKKAAASLRVTLSRLRKGLQPAGECLRSEGGAVAFDLKCVHELDLAWLRTAADAEILSIELDPILTVDRGEFLEGFSLPDAPDFDTWAAIQRETCQREVETIYDRLSRHELAAHNSARAVESAARWVARAPLSEVAYRRLMAAQALSGKRGAALQTYERCRVVLAKEFGIEPARETTALAENITRGRGSVGPGEEAAGVGVTTASRAARDRRRLTLPLVGRDREHELMVQAYRQASAEGARAVAIIGAGGVGKTRLVDAFQEWVVLDTPGVEVWRGRAFETGGRLPYQPVIEALRLRLDQENAPEDLLDDVWLAELSQLMPELRARYPDLPPPMTGEANFVRSRLFAALAALGSALAGGRRAVFILDDMQWADGDTLDLVHYLSRRWSEMDVPVLLLLTVRRESFAADAGLREWLARLGRDVPLTRLLLDTLSATAVQELIARLSDPVAAADAARDFAAWLWAETRGLPFFIEAVLQMLVEQDLLTVIDEMGPPYDFASALSHVQSLTHMPLPPGVREVILARTQQLSPEANTLLLAAAVIGRACTFERLRQVADIAEEEALATVETLLNLRLLSERRAERRPYTLAHDYIREVVYDESREARRRVFHRRALLALEADRAPAAECAFHAVASLLDEPAFRFSLAAGDEALASWAFAESLAHYERARAVVQRLGATTAAIAPQALRHLYQNRGRALELVEDYEAAEANYDELRSLAAARQDRTLEMTALTAQCIIHARHNPIFDPARAGKEGEAALALARALDDREAEAKASWALMLVGIYGGGSREVIRAFGQRAVSLARELGLTELVGYVLINLCWPYVAQNELAEALAVLDEARDIWQQLGNQPMLLETYDMRQFVLSVTGDHDGVEAAAREVLRLCDVTGNQGYKGAALRFMALARGLRGQFEEALALLDAAASVPVHRSFSAHGQYDAMLMLHYLAGAPDQAGDWADKLAAAIQERSIPVFESYYLTNVARANVARGKLVEGKAILDGALAALAPDAVWAHTIIGMAIVYGQIDLAQGEPGRVFDRLDERVDSYRKAGFRYSLAEEYLLRGRAHSALGQVEAAWAALQKAKEVAEAQQERVMLWQILVMLSALEQEYGDRNAAEQFRDQAREVVSYIADHAGPLRDVFLAQPQVAQLLGKTSPRAADPQMGLPLA